MCIRDRNTIVAYNHFHRAKTKLYNKKKVDVENLRKQYKEWYKDCGWAKRDGFPGGSFEYSHENEKNYSYIKESFWSGDYENTARYLEATRMF